MRTESTLGPTAGPGDGEPAEVDARRQRREEKRRAQAEEPLDPAARYKALLDTLESEQEMVELADRKVRFALVVIGGLNAVLVLVTVREGGPLPGIAGAWAYILHGLLGTYAATGLLYFVQAIEALRPRTTPSSEAIPTAPAPGVSLRLRFHRDIVRRSREAYHHAWTVAGYDHLAAEVAAQVHIVASINVRKYAALDRLYRGLIVMTVLVALVLVTLAVHAIAA